MILRDLVTDLILKTDAMMSKKGQDINLRKDVVRAINAVTGEDSLDTIYINNIDHYNIPDVFVMPLYNKEFNYFALDTDITDMCPFGYTIEIHQRCFDKYNAEELVAIIIHDILQNVQSCSAKTRFLAAYNAAVSKFNVSDILNIFDDLSISEVTYIAMMDICLRPFRVPTSNYDYVGTDDVLRSMKLSDAYDSALVKMLPMSNKTPEDVIQEEVEKDYRTLRTIIMACKDHTIRLYYNMIKEGLPLVTTENILNTSANTTSLGFISRRKNFKKRYELDKAPEAASTITESYINPQNEIELRFQIDKIMMEMKYAENESEREVILVKIRNLTVKLAKTKKKLEESLKTHPDDKNIRYKLDYTTAFLAELEVLRDKTVNMEIKEKRYGIFVKYPVGYQY